ncbi:gluconolaconase [Mycolicibacterium chitae]|uniref:Glucose/sorbosone dehydrogenase n=1 Tax=Mycolicibacterium chitae TaxID=1792 RepID=A0A448ICI1_MYCCI|nr:gluconolaconase [Mycolicibacterium chitae]MCV7104357.1 gluconolaconase [Mycolicibacterium chitae]BBZ01334.1 gluconolaconase [Mycolicibacterium chitae]VEG50173.1 glucose/sorbosone dehydrogenase [Mycolicibacterium chitae]
MRAWARKSWVVLAGVALSAALVAGCGSAPPPEEPRAVPSPTAAPPPPGLVPVTVEVPENMRQQPFTQPREALVPEGWTMSVYARTSGPRLLAWAPDGVLLVSVPSTGEVLRIGDDGETSVLLGELTEPHGLAFDGNRLYVAESNQVSVYSYADGQATNPQVIAPGLPDGSLEDLRGIYEHALKSVVLGADGSVLFSIGSTGNISAEDRDAEPPRATIMRIPPGGGAPEPFATGVRNGTGLAVAPDGGVWTAVNGRDNVPEPETGEVRTGYVNDNPPEALALLTPGRELGWPFCNPVGGPTDLGFARDAQTNPDGSRMDCAALPPIERSLPAHSAPLGMNFVELPPPYGPGALIGVHGSWNRTPPRAPEVAFFAWRDGVLGEQQTLVGGFQYPDGTRWGRPVAAVVGPDGAVYISDDYADAVYRLAPPA